jgi:hypothetical protein
MSTEAEEIQRIVSASVRDMLDAFRLQAAAGPMTDKALQEIIFRRAQGVLGEPPAVFTRATGRAAAERRAPHAHCLPGEHAEGGK